MWKKIINWLKSLFKKFVLDTGLLEKGLDKVIKELLAQGVKASSQLEEYIDQLLIELKKEFGNIKAINKVIDYVVYSLNGNFGSTIDKLQGGVKAKLELLKEKLIEIIVVKLK